MKGITLVPKKRLSNKTKRKLELRRLKQKNKLLSLKEEYNRIN